MARPRKPSPIVVGGTSDGTVNPEGPDFSNGNSGSFGPDGILTIDPATLAGSGGNSGGPGDAGGSSAEQPKRRGRKPGSRNNPRSKDTLNIKGLSDILLSTHTMLAALTKTPEFLLSDEESKAIAEAVGNVARHYDNIAIAEKTVDWVSLITACGAVYGPRVVAFRMRTSSNRAKSVNEPIRPTTAGNSQAKTPKSSPNVEPDDYVVVNGPDGPYMVYKN